MEKCGKEIDRLSGKVASAEISARGKTSRALNHS
jgi:hypothetical protein